MYTCSEYILCFLLIDLIKRLRGTNIIKIFIPTVLSFTVIKMGIFLGIFIFFKFCMGFLGWFLIKLLLLKIVICMKKCYRGFWVP